MEHTLSNPVSTTHASTASAPSFSAIWRVRNFRLLWIGEGISVLGDHFSLIALPWLVLQLTGDSLAMGTVTALQTIPRTLFMLLGGAITDRFSPRTIMLASNFIRLIMITFLAIFVWLGAIQMWMLYAYALLFGVVGAFFYPANSAIAPRLLKKDYLQMGNSLIMSTMMIGMIIGPALAGGLIATFNSANNLRGIAIAFGADALSFLASITALMMMRSQDEQITDVDHSENVLDSIRQGLNYMWNEKTIRTVYFIAAVGTFLSSGPVMIGLPVLANTRYAEGAVAYGIFMSASAAGMLVGMMSAGALPKPKPEKLGATLVAVYASQGFGVALLPFVPALWLAALLSLVIGAMGGYVNVTFMSWFQRHTPSAMLGRMMSLLNIAMMGLSPISTALAGALSTFGVATMLSGAGCLMAVTILLMSLNPNLRAMGIEQEQTQ